MRLIDADSLKLDIDLSKGATVVDMALSVIKAVQEAPTADVTEVVRCKDCKWWENGKDYTPYCNHWGNMMTDTQADDYCSYGERKMRGNESVYV